MRNVFLPLTGVMLVLTATCTLAVDTVQFNGLVEQACSLQIVGSPVFMGNYPTSKFSARNTTTEYKNFSINISGCQKSRIALKWGGNTVINNADLLAVDGAKGLGIRIIDQKTNQRAIFNQDPTDNMYITMPDTGIYTFSLSAFYISFQDSVTAGPANASANVELVYN
ncbi:fimbrial protein [Erwinia piriflorinigrans]|uniref:Type-1 fimbrial protein subunit n=1 Tax=Erwinia piriflorinigrans CFBP 5888 TaxID=1161919 RepID=V5ZAJ7_9GAMM|nr:fimbrial protein [Erwinia piriflorinigrans]CCG88401.1 Type-1 fimbrial protein subunit [Erwinia piriflorinigrans CFBP 5888]